MPKLGTPEWNMLLQRLRSNDTTLTELDLRASLRDLEHNPIGDAGAKDLSLALKDNYTLTSLNLGSNQIGDAGAKNLSLALKGNHTLTSLILWHNQIGDAGAKDLSLILKGNHTLTSLGLWFNQIGDAGAKDFSLALKDNYTLTSLHLKYDLIYTSRRSEIIEKVIAYYLERNLTLLGQLHQAVKAGNQALAQQLLAQGVSLLSVDGLEGNTPLHWAIEKGHAQLATWLKQEMERQGLPLSMRNRQGLTAEALAAKNPACAAVFQSSAPSVSPNPTLQTDVNNNNTMSTFPTLTPLQASLPTTLQTIPWQSLQREDPPIGSGGFGEVHRATWYGKTVAVKSLYLKTLSADIYQSFQQEATLMAQLHFPNIVQFFGACLEPGHYALVMEYLPKGSLYDVLHNKTLALPWNPLRWQIAIGTAQGLAYLHGQQVVHQDLKSLNVLLDKDWIPKIADFGLSRIKLETTSTTSLGQTKTGGSVRWRAPELFKRGAKPNFASDVYSLGMVYWEIASRQLPYSDGLDDVTVMGWIKDGEQETLPADCPPPFGTLIQACWSLAPQRPSALEVLEKLQKAFTPEASPIKSWHFAAEIKTTLAPSNNNNVSSYQLLEAAPSDIQKVLTYYQHHPVPNMDIKQIQVIYNPAMNRGFALRMELLQARKNQPAFAPKWSQKVEAAGEQAQRQKTAALAQTLSQPHQDSDYPAVNLLPVWHGTKRAVLPSLLTTGYANLATTDSGFFGKGIYSAQEAEYAYRVYGNDGILVMNWVAYFSAYPVIRPDMADLMSKGSYQNYDAHFVPVVPANPHNPKETNYFPCQPGQSHQYTEVVVFESAQCLPRYLIELQPTLSPAPALLPAGAPTASPSSTTSIAGAPPNAAHYPQSFFAAAKAATPPSKQPSSSTTPQTQQGALPYPSYY